MTLQDKITLQSENHFRALAFKEGFFYKVYNEGAWFLRSKNFKIQQIGKGTLKSVFVGFPESVMLAMANNFRIDTKSNSTEIATNELFDAIAYEDWKAKIESLIPQDIVSTNQANTENAQKILFEIRDYPLASKTPIEVFIWISQIQSLIRQSIK